MPLFMPKIRRLIDEMKREKNGVNHGLPKYPTAKSNDICIITTPIFEISLLIEKPIFKKTHKSDYSK